MYFLMALVVLHDNIMRQDIAICLAYPAYYLILDDELKIRNKVLKIIILTIIAFFFHYSAVFLLPFYFFRFRPLSKLKTKLCFNVLFAVLVVWYSIRSRCCYAYIIVFICSSIWIWYR